MNRTVPVAVASWERGKSVAEPRFPPVCPAQVTPQGTEPPAGLGGVKLLVQPVVTLGNFASTLRLSSRPLVYQILSPPKC